MRVWRRAIIYFTAFQAPPVRGTLQPIAIQFLNRCAAVTLQLQARELQADLQALQVLRRRILLQILLQAILQTQKLICRKKARLQALQVLPIPKLICRKKVRLQALQKADSAERARALLPRLKDW